MRSPRYYVLSVFLILSATFPVHADFNQPLLRFDLIGALSQNTYPMTSELRAELILVQSISQASLLKPRLNSLDVDQRYARALTTLKNLQAKGGPHYLATYLALIQIVSDYQSHEFTRVHGAAITSQRRLLRQVAIEIGILLDSVGRRPDILSSDFLLHQFPKSTLNKDKTGPQLQPDRYQFLVRELLKTYVESNHPTIRLAGLLGLRHVLPPRANMGGFLRTGEILWERMSEQRPKVLEREQTAMELVYSDLKELADNTVTNDNTLNVLNKLYQSLWNDTGSQGELLVPAREEIINRVIDVLADRRQKVANRKTAAEVLVTLANEGDLASLETLIKIRRILEDPAMYEPAKLAAAEAIFLNWDIVLASPEEFPRFVETFIQVQSENPEVHYIKSQMHELHRRASQALADTTNKICPVGAFRRVKTN